MFLTISTQMWGEVAWSTWQTVYMVLIAGLISVAIGMPLGVLLKTTRPGHVLAQTALHKVLAFVVNAMRSIPFIILMFAMIPLTRFIVGTSIGTSAAMVPLVFAAFPFVARVVENALDEISPGLLEAAEAMGASPWQIILKVMLPESLAGMVNGLTLMVITLIGYSAMAGAVGGGGLGDLAIRYGYERFDVRIMVVTVVILIVMVQLIQWLGSWVAAALRK